MSSFQALVEIHQKRQLSHANTSIGEPQNSRFARFACNVYRLWTKDPICMDRIFNRFPFSAFSIQTILVDILSSLQICYF